MVGMEYRIGFGWMVSGCGVCELRVMLGVRVESGGDGGELAVG